MNSWVFDADNVTSTADTWNQTNFPSTTSPGFSPVFGKTKRRTRPVNFHLIRLWLVSKDVRNCFAFTQHDHPTSHVHPQHLLPEPQTGESADLIRNVFLDSNTTFNRITRSTGLQIVNIAFSSDLLGSDPVMPPGHACTPRNGGVPFTLPFCQPSRSADMGPARHIVQTGRTCDEGRGDPLGGERICDRAERDLPAQSLMITGSHERTLAYRDLGVSNPHGWLQSAPQGVGCHDECGQMPALFSSYSHIHRQSCPCTGICVPAVTARQHATPSHQENLKFLDWTWAALKRLLRTFQGHFFQDRSKQVIPLILCLVRLESLIVLLTNHQPT